MTRAAAAVLLLGSSLLLGGACRRDRPPPAPVAPAAVPTPAAPPTPNPPPPAAAVAPAVDEAPLTPCQRKCSISSNHKQLRGFLRCEKVRTELEACKAKVLEETDAGRRACRESCDGRSK